MNHKATFLDWEKVSKGIRRLMAEKRDQDLLLIACAAFTGCRPGDFTKFQWDTFMGPDGKAKNDISIVETKVKNIAAANGKKASKRKIFLLPQFRQVLEECYARRERYDGGYIFWTKVTYKHTPKGITTQTANKWLKRLAVELELPNDITTYSFRRTCARRIFESYKKKDLTLAIRLTQQFLNHQDARSTMAYIGLMDEELQAAFSKLTI